MMMEVQGIENHIVKSRANSHNIDDDFEHPIDHAMPCTLESGEGCAMGYGVVRFGSLDEVIDGDDLGCLSEGKARGLRVLDGCSTYRASGARSSLNATAFQ